MKTIHLTQNQVALVSDCDYAELNKHKWCVIKHRNKTREYYSVVRGVRKDNIYTGLIMSRVIMNPPKNMVVDHIDGNPLNNQRENLRICTPGQNAKNRGKSPLNTSGYKGVSWYPLCKGWIAFISVDKKRKTIGYFETAELAYDAYCKKALELHGEFANLG